MEGRFSEKSDVFSLGVLLLEIISGRKNNSFEDNELLSLLSYVRYAPLITLVSLTRICFLVFGQSL